ncbi:MAG: c-type cytochrome [Planctomycetota bacterium]
MMLRGRLRNGPMAMLFALVFSIPVSFADDKSPPRVFLDKSPRIVQYQLKRLSDERLLMVERETSDAKYIPVYEAIVSRPGMSADKRQASLEALTELRSTSVAEEILQALKTIDRRSVDPNRLQALLTRQLLAQPIGELQKLSGALADVASGGDEMIRPVGFAALVSVEEAEKAQTLALEDSALCVAYLHGVALIKNANRQTECRDFVVSRLERFWHDGDSDGFVAAIDAISRIPAEQADTAERLFGYLASDEHHAEEHYADEYRAEICRGLLRLPKELYPKESLLSTAESLTSLAESTDAKDRTSDDFTDVMQFAESVFTRLDSKDAKRLRDRLREVTVRVIKIATVEEEMRYDVPYFAVEAGRTVQILLENHDLMPHNLVVTRPDALKGVAMAGLAAGPKGFKGLPYVPDSPNVLAASEMIQPDESTRITITVPSEPGEYPYVCTFPQHWYRMYGVMVVVEDLEAWNQNPTEPANPLGSNRSFVQAWTLDDFEGSFERGFEGRSMEIGEKIFNEASCAGCHKVRGVGGAVGPELTDVYARWKGDHTGLLREILEPSYKIDEKYAMKRILTVDGNTYAGIVIEENDDEVRLVASPDDKEPIVIAQDDIEVMKRNSTSMMPKALMDQFTKEEVVEMMAYLHFLANEK